MNNEETIIMKPQTGNSANETTLSQPTAENQKTEKKSNTGKKVAATAGAAVLGGAAGAGGMYAADKMMQKPEEEQEQEAKAEEAKEEPATTKETAAASKPKQEEPEVAVHVTPVDGNQEGPDYTGHNGANPSTPNPGVHQTSAQSSGNETADVRVVDIQHAQTPDGHTAEAVILTDGETVGAVIDTDGDGKADLFAADTNHNNRFDDNEAQNIQGDNISMEGFHQEPQTQTYAASSNTGSDVNEVQVLGVDSEQGIAVVSIEGEAVGLVDANHDGTIEYAVHDDNDNHVIEEGEVIDISSDQIQMSTIEDVAQQQQEQMQQEQDTFAYNASDDQSDYTNDVDPQFA